MMDAIERARAERRLALRLFAVLLAVVAAIYGMLVYATAPSAPVPAGSTPRTEVAQ